jgi:hypothetical protein
MKIGQKTYPENHFKFQAYIEYGHDEYQKIIKNSWLIGLDLKGIVSRDLHL